jgi:hypothetical protein
MRGFFWGPGRWRQGPRGYNPWSGWGGWGGWGRWGRGRWGGGGCGCCGLALFALLVLLILMVLFVLPRSRLQETPPSPDSRPLFYVAPANMALAEWRAQTH